MNAASGTASADNSRETSRRIRLGGSILGAQRHICAFFNSPDEQDRTLLPFIRDGFDRGEQAVHIIDPGCREEHVWRLRAAGIDAAAAEQLEPPDGSLMEWIRSADCANPAIDAHQMGRALAPHLTADASGATLRIANPISAGTASNAARLVAETDRDRAAFIRTYFSRASPNRAPVR